MSKIKRIAKMVSFAAMVVYDIAKTAADNKSAHKSKKKKNHKGDYELDSDFNDEYQNTS